MAYRFRAKDRTVEEAVRRIAHEQVDGAIHAIDARHASVATHEARKCCKKVRALLRLVRPAFPDYAQENRDFRDIARSLSGSRDAKVLLDTCDLLIEGAPTDADTELFLPLRRRLARDLAKQAHGDDAAAHLKAARKLLEKAQARCRRWTLEHDGWDALGEGLCRIVRDARKAERQVQAEPSAMHYHELRKLMKYHWYHTRLLVPLWPETMAPRAAELSRLADELGLHHDICVFEQWLGAALPTLEGFDVAENLLPLAGERRRQLEARIAPQAARALAQKPAELADHWRALWCIWRSEAADEED
ncbi:MAG TPA: CHAD domain-containing protein [Novosphingobium sp.]|nr:CHAD domain-containing protein [Novosphingobium sp.]